MTTRARIRRALPLALALTLACTGLARADAAYDRVAAAYAAAGGQLEACRFTQADLQAALDGIPAELKDVVPDLRRAIEDGIRAHEDGDCEGVEPTASGDAEPAPAAATPPVTTPTTPAGAAAPTTTAPAAPGATPPTVPAPGAAAPTPGADGAVTTPSRQPPGVPRDRTPLAVGAIALGAVALLVLALWGLAQARGWDPPWLARVRHAWAEAGYRASATWAEFADWLRLGR
jgi:hypothetical protein